MPSYFDVIWPSTRHPPPPAVLAFMDELANSFGLERVTSDNPLTRQVHWITRDSEVERNYWRNCDKPAARFFIEANPGYGEGDGLVTLVRVDAHNLRHMISTFFAERYTRRKEGLMVMLYRLPIGGQLLRPAEVIRRLKATALFGSFDAPSLATLARSAQIVALPAGRTIFRAGDPGDELYVIARGAAYVLAGGEGEARKAKTTSSTSWPAATCSARSPCSAANGAVPRCAPPPPRCSSRFRARRCSPSSKRTRN